ncbi:MAG: YbhB/YbcL family Raf kinase inhibitor-like protein [Proteobacteria bacterium]|nr:MAG: YbhB/YbcL family Raf kinase inhibitor-like protein [Pseudomonadota bacterium]
MKRFFSHGLHAVAACALLASTAAAADGFRLTSPAFAAGAGIPEKYTCEGGSVSPPLAWTDPPAGTQSFVLSVSDPDSPDPAAPLMTWVHWVVYGLPADARALAEGASRKLPPGARHALNDWKSPDYGGPCPPKGRHRYVFKLYALDVPPSNRGSIPHANLGRMIKTHVLGTAELVATYEKQRR